MVIKKEDELNVFLEKACSGDEALRLKVDQLFESIPAAEEFFTNLDVMKIEVPGLSIKDGGEGDLRLL